MSDRASILCPECRRLIHKDEDRCPHCGALKPALFGFAPWLQRTLRGDLVAAITAVSVVLYLSSVAIDLAGARFQLALFGFGSPSHQALLRMGMTGGQAWAQGHWWTLLSANFLHGDALHIAFNMLWLRVLGPQVLEHFGRARLLILYLLTGAGGFLFSNLVSGAPTIGASCAVFGLLGALVAYGRRRGGTIGANMTRTHLIWAGIGAMYGLALPGVNNWGHAGGFLAGLLLGALMPMAGRSDEGRGAMVLAALLCLCTAGAVVASLVLSFTP